MIVSGLGTKDSPILLDDDSECEVVTELIGTPSPCLAHPEGSESTPRLSPRPGTFLSDAARLNLSKSSAQNLKKYRQDLRQRTHGRKRKQAPTASHVNGGPCLARGQLDSANTIVDVMVDGPKRKRESETQHRLLNPPEKLSQSRVGPPAKRPKRNHKPNNELIASSDSLLTATLKESTPMSTSKTSGALGPTSCPNASRPIPKHTPFSDSTTLPSAMSSTSYQFDPTSLPFPVTAQDIFAGQLVSMTQEPLPGVNMDFDPMFWAMSMSMNGFAMSSTSIPPMGITLPSNPTISGKQQSKLQLPPSKPTVSGKQQSKLQLLPSKSSAKSGSKLQLPSSKASTKPVDAILEHLPARPPCSNEKSSVSRQRPFTLRLTDQTMTASAYLPIGKPDFRDIHGIFPIVPSLMLHAPSGTGSASHTPDLDRTLVLENLPKCTCSKFWIQNWCLKTCGSLPELLLVGPRRALVTFKQPEHAIDAWASPKLGVDANGFYTVNAVGESKPRLDVITAYWYRPDAVKERQLVISWKSSKKIVTEIKEMLALPVDESVVAKVLTELSDEMLELCQAQEQVQMKEPRLALQKMADQMGFHEKLAKMIGEASTEEDLLKWEQKEIALIERERRLKSLPQNRTRHSELGKVGGDEERNKSAFCSVNAQPMTEFAPHWNQRNALSTSTSTGCTVSTNVVSGPSSMSNLSLASTSSLLSAKARSFHKLQLSSSNDITTTANRTTPQEKLELRFGQTAWKSPEFTISSMSTNAKAQQIRIHPEHPSLGRSFASHQSEQRKSNPSPSTTVGTPMKHPPAQNPSLLPSTLPARSQFPGMPSCDATIPPIFSPAAWNLPNIYPTLSSFTEDKSPSDTLPMSQARPILDDHKEAAESLESQTVSSDISLQRHSSMPVGVDESPVVTMAITSVTSNPPSSAAKIPSKPVDLHGSVEPQLPMASTSESSVTSESVSILNPGKTAASTSTRTSASSSLASTPVTAVASRFGEYASDRIQISDTMTVQSVAVKVGSPAATAPPLTLVSAPRPPPGIPLKILQELKRVLAKSTEERQKFLDDEFKATRLLMDQLMTITCKKERKQVTDLWKQKIRIIDEVTKSIRNDAKVWYSQEMKTWIHMRWPGCLDISGALVIDDED